MRKKRRRQSTTFFDMIGKLFLLIFILIVGVGAALYFTDNWEQPYQAVLETVSGWVQSAEQTIKDSNEKPSENNNAAQIEDGTQQDSVNGNTQVHDQDGQAPSSDPPNGSVHDQAEVLQPPARAELPAGMISLGQARSTTDTPVHLLEAMDGIELRGESLFSAQEWLAQAPDAVQAASDLQLSLALSVFYEAAVRAGLEIGERKIHEEWDQRFKPGFDIDFSVDGADLQVYNPNGFAMLFQVSRDGDQLVASWIGEPSEDWAAPTVNLTTETIAPEELLIIDHKLTSGQRLTKELGKPGQLVKVFRQQPGEGQPDLFMKDFYAPLPIVIHRGPTHEELASL